jgi:omega-amidase
MKLALIQRLQHWENTNNNLAHFEEKINTINQEVDIIILPEMFTTGFTMNAHKVAETMNGTSVSWLKKIANEKNSAICASLVIEENNKYYNRMLFVEPNGKITHYNKRHLFTLAGEDKVYTKGQEKVIVNYKGFAICLQICYDLRFPVFVRNKEDYDAIIYVANWPVTRISAWDTLLKARAIENQCFVIGVNRTGTDANNLEYPGHSQVIDELGNYLVKPTNEDAIYYCELSKHQMLATREKLAFLKDRDNFEI